MMPSQASSDTYSCGAPTVARPHAAAPNSPPSPRLVAGPAAVMRKSAPGVWGSERNCAKPPNIHKVMPSTATSLRRATIECAIS